MIRETFIFIVALRLFPISLLGKVFCGCFGQVLFNLGDKKKVVTGCVRLVVVLYSTVMIVWKFAWVDSALVVLDKWLSYRGGRLSRFDFIPQFK